ncbi:hypothetical protein CDAR_608951 [Caerostris darwini]|uniref:Uncharacterized protein n=1 Tax=Caerostris darwini TaxID=1538125 RepID=A0AAV4WLJ5_9ARAC|nr:hypothetical protein CDAR_608951 [Caerostris darwini]
MGDSSLLIPATVLSIIPGRDTVLPIKKIAEIEKNWVDVSEVVWSSICCCYARYALDVVRYAFDVVRYAFDVVRYAFDVLLLVRFIYEGK